jgi:acyl-CoA thioester hydrolase
MDAFGHVNNAVYLTYLEEARVAFMQANNMRSLNRPERSTILAHAEIDYRAPAHLGDVLNIDLVVSKVGNSSYEFTYVVSREGDGALVAQAKSVQVCYNFTLSRVIRVPAEWREALVKFRPKQSL